MQAASAMGFNPASARAAAQEATVGAKAAMHSVVVISRDYRERYEEHTEVVAATSLLSVDESLSLSLEGIHGINVAADDHVGGSSENRSGEESDSGDGELHFESC